MFILSWLLSTSKIYRHIRRRRIKITVITVTYNSAKTILDTLHSVRVQSHRDIEHVIVDGASQDNTLEIIGDYNNPNIFLISEPDQGIYDAMNKGLSLAKGDVIGFLNSDDFYIDAAVLEKVSRVFEDPSVDACYADLNYVTEDTSRVVRYWKSNDFVRGDFSKGWCPAHPTFFVRRSVYERFGCFDLSYKIAADVELMMRFLDKNKIRSKYVPEVFVKMRIGGTTNKSLSNIYIQNREIICALKKHGLYASLLCFMSNKFVSRAKQYLMRWR